MTDTDLLPAVARESARPPQRRNIDPDVARLRGTLGPLERDGRAEEAAQVRQELQEAKFLASARKVAAQIAEMTAENPQVAAKARAILNGGA